MGGDFSSKFLVVVISLAMSVLLIRILKHVGEREMIKLPTEFNLSTEPTEFTVPVNMGPSYFTSSGKIYILYYSPYAGFFSKFNVTVSLDRTNWKTVSLQSTLPEDYSSFVELGYVELSKPVEIFGKYEIKIIKPKELTLLPDLSKEEMLESVEGYVLVEKQTTPFDKTLELIAGSVSFIAIFNCLEFFLKPRTVREEEEFFKK